MAAANDNQGLKIAVAALVMLVFILGVTNYFAFSSASQNLAQKEAESKKRGEAESQARANLESANTYKAAIGFGTIEDADAVKAAMTKHHQGFLASLQTIGTETNEAINTVQQAGTPDPKLDDLKQVGTGIVATIVSEPNENKVYTKTVDRLKDLLINQSRLMREMSLDYRKLRSGLESANSTNSVEVAKVNEARDKAFKEKQTEIDRFKSELQGLYDQLTNLQNTDKEKTNTITDLTNKMSDEANKSERTKIDLVRQIRDLRDRLAGNMNSLPAGKASGRVTFVDNNRGEVRVSVNKSDGVRPMMRFAIFDRDARGISSEKPKGTVELISVGDPARGERDSVARIMGVKNPIDPIRYNDQIYSPSMGAERYAIIGKIDINRDGKDDRAEFIRLIEQSGGYVEYDLAPPGTDRSSGRMAVERAFVQGNEPVPARTGQAWGRISRAKNYVIDTQTSLSGEDSKAGLTADDVAFNKEKSDAIKEARSTGIPPLEMSRLLVELGYSRPSGTFGTGRVETKNSGALKSLLKPKPVMPGANAPGATTTNPNAAPAPEAEPAK